MTEVIRAAAELQRLCERQQWAFCFIGGLALQRWGEPRETVDVDLTLFTGWGLEQPFVDVLLSHFETRIDHAAEFALTRRVLLLRAKSGVGLDIALAGLPFEARVVARGSLFDFPGPVPLRTCSAEDLVVLKAFAARGKDWIDIQGIVARQAGRLDWSAIRSELKPLVELKDSPEILEQIEKVRLEFEP